MGVRGSSAFRPSAALRDSWNNRLTTASLPPASISVMAVDRRKVAVFGAAFVLRLLLICLFPSLPDLLTGRVEVSTPVNSFKRRTR
jgi:hypothetical protein